MSRILRALVAELLLLVGLELAVVDESTGERQHVEGDRTLVLLGCRERHRLTVVGELGGAVVDLANLLVELVDTGQPAARHGLVGGGDQTHEAGLVVERLQHRHRRHRRAVGVGDDALRGVANQVAVDLADHQRHFGVHAPRRRVVDHRRAGAGELGGQHLGGGGAGREQGDVEAARVGQLGVLDHDLGALPRQRRAGRTGRCEEPDLVDREFTLCQQAAHDTADLTCCTNHCYSHGQQG